MTVNQELKIKNLLKKYNAILLHSMRLAIAEDFISLVLLNKEDAEIELEDLSGNRNEYYTYILKEFMKHNSSSVLDELKEMEDPIAELKRNFLKVTKKNIP
jgi:hypothetical protein